MTSIQTLQVVLEHRGKIVEEREKKLQKITQQISELEKLLDQEKEFYFNEKDLLNEHILNNQRQYLDVYDQSLEMRKTRMMEILKMLKEFKQEQERAKFYLVEAKRDLKSIEKLKEHRLDEERKKEEIKESKRMDELAQIGFLRQTWAQGDPS